MARRRAPRLPQRAGRPGPYRHDPRDRRPRRQALGAHGSAQGYRRSRLHLPHQLPQPEGRRARRKSARGAGAVLAGARSAGAHYRPRFKTYGGRIGRLFRHPARGKPVERGGLAAKRRNRVARGARAKAGGGEGPVSRRRAAASKTLGRLSCPTRRDRILAAGPASPA